MCFMLITMLAAVAVGKRASFQREASQGSRVMTRLLKDAKHQDPSDTRRRLDSGDSGICGPWCLTKKAVKYAVGAVDTAGRVCDDAIYGTLNAAVEGGRAAVERFVEIDTAMDNAVYNFCNEVKEDLTLLDRHMKLSKAEDWFWPEIAAETTFIRNCFTSTVRSGTKSHLGQWEMDYWLFGSGDWTEEHRCTSCKPLADVMLAGLESCYEHRNAHSPEGHCCMNAAQVKKLEVIYKAVEKHLKVHKNINSQKRPWLYMSQVYLKTIIDEHVKAGE